MSKTMNFFLKYCGDARKTNQGPPTYPTRTEDAEKQPSQDATTTQEEQPPYGSFDEEGTWYPEGGLQAWLVALGSFCGMLTGFGVMNTISVFNAYISTHQLKDYQPNTISWIFSIYIFLAFFCGLQIGPVFDAYGPKELMAAGGACLITGCMLLGVCTKYWHFILVFSILCGTGNALIFTPSIAAIAHWFHRRRGLATGLAATGGAIGGVVFPLMLESLFTKIGWAWSTRVLGFIFLLLSTTAVFLVRSRLPPRRGARTSWRDTLPDFRIFLDGTGALALTTAGIYFVEWGLFIPVSFLTSYALYEGVNPTFSYQLIAIFNAGSVFGRVIPGYAADKLGRFNTMLLTVLLCLISAFALWLPSHGSIPLLIVFAVIFGFGSGSNISLTPICVGQLCATQEFGRYYATSYTVVSFGTLTGLPIAGALISAAGGSFWAAIVFTGACYAAAFLSFGAVRVGKAGWNLRSVW